MSSATAVVTPTSERGPRLSSQMKPEVSFEKHADHCQQCIEKLWEQIEETGMTAREMFEMLQQPSVKALTIGALQQTDVNTSRPLAVLKVSQEKECTYDKTLLLVALNLVTMYHFPVFIMPNGSDGKGKFENRLMVLGDPPDYVR